MKVCEKCSDKIPHSVIIDGKRRFTSNRRFCLKCSPFGQHNTSKNPDKRPFGKKIYSSWSESRKKAHRDNLKKRRTERKIKLVNMFGGKCQKCGYNKCMAALQFHHRDPSIKEFMLNVNWLATKSWEKVVLEAKKCDLLCSNCHLEFHHMIS